jgi:D-cysteine desulfhydrase/L-cysteate sulfo-lyase
LIDLHADEFALLPQLHAHARVDLGLIKTPIEELARLSDDLGVELSIKRDDILPLGMGGNKIRQLEYYLGPAVEQGADTVVITGAVQSNFVRLCAAAARKLGLHPVLQLEERSKKQGNAHNRSGNVLIDKMLGADIHSFSEGENEAAADANLDMIADRLRAQGRRPYTIHLGLDHPPLGGLGYALGAAEAFLQCRASDSWPDHVVMPSGSGLTHAGFLVGARALGWKVPIHGICVRRSAQLQHARVLQRGQEIAAMLQDVVTLQDADVQVDDTMLAPGYGSPSAKVMEAVHHAARAEALLFDPVYVGRGFSGLIHLVETGTIKPGERVMFLHTGGTPGIFAYEHEIVESAPS